jgi:carbamoyl-phosphate synthase small subunit
MKLGLADGTVLRGRSFGAPNEARGEVVFHTGMVGYVEALTDPSYRGQILVLTYPLIGNYGVPADGLESDRIQVQGLVVSRYAPTHSHYAAVQSLGDWLSASGVPAISGVDTRSLVQKLRSHGTMAGALLHDQTDAAHGLAESPGIAMRDAVSLVEPHSIVELPGPGPRILVIDTGAKESIIRSLRVRGAAVIRAGGEQQLGSVSVAGRRRVAGQWAGRSSRSGATDRASATGAGPAAAHLWDLPRSSAFGALSRWRYLQAAVWASLAQSAGARGRDAAGVHHQPKSRLRGRRKDAAQRRGPVV